MKVTIGPYVDRWVSYVHYNYMNKKYDFRWDDNNTRYERFLERLEDTLQWIYNHSINLFLDKKQRKVKVKIHNYDTWAMDDTLALIILPMLKQLKATKHGVPMVDNEDVPEHLRQVLRQFRRYSFRCLCNALSRGGLSPLTHQSWTTQ